MQPANDAAAVVPAITDALLDARADALMSCTEGSEEERELQAITDAIEAYDFVPTTGYCAQLRRR